MKNDSNNRWGIIAAGNWIIDHIKVVDIYPLQDSLANVKKEFFSNGGSPYNILKNLSKLSATFPLRGMGLVGDDDFGKHIISDCASHGIDTTTLRIISHTPTSYTDVMTVESSGRRTFFHQRGANAFLDVPDFDFSGVTEKFFHLGYLLLLDKLDNIYDDGTSGASRVLDLACKAGLKTSVDIVSEDSYRFKKIILPALPYIHFLFLNEFEAGRCTGIHLTTDKPEYEALNKAATIILDYGIREWVFIHFATGVFAKNKNGEILIQGSVNLPSEKVISALGAGDALASGILYAIHEGWEIPAALRLGVCSAASCLQELSSSEGILSYDECMRLGDTYDYIHLSSS
jgi:sugar/nucleoside kinase (ribokinase family)